MIVYRIEHQWRNVGPWQNQTNFSFTKAWRQAKAQRPPNPERDANGRKIKPDEYVGCGSLEQLLHWFDGVLYWLKAKDFCIKVFETEDYTVLGHQILFKNETARCVQILPIEA